MQADGDDLRVFQDGVEVDRWLNGINTTDTHVIVNVDMPASATVTLATAIGSTDTVTQVDVDKTDANADQFSNFPTSGRLIIDASLGSTDTEEFTYTAKGENSTAYYFTIEDRSVRNTSGYAHAVGANVRFLPFDFTLVYGSSDASAPVTDDTRKPLQDLTSRNWSYSYTYFYDEQGTRPGSWKKLPRKVSNQLLTESLLYTSTDDAGDTDPATALGMKAATYESGGVWLGDTVNQGWVLSIPDGFDNITPAGAQNQSSTSRPSAFFSGYSDLPFPQPAFYTVPAQSATDYSTWSTWSSTSKDVTVNRLVDRITWRQKGSITGSTDESAKVELSSMTITTVNYPHVTIRDEPAAVNNNNLDFKLSNATTGESLRIIYPLTLNEKLTIDTNPDFPNAKVNGQIVNGAVELSSIRTAWLKLNPGSNTIGFDTNLAVATNITITIKWRDRLNFL